jgi:hypothetical protein
MTDNFEEEVSEKLQAAAGAVFSKLKWVVGVVATLVVVLNSYIYVEGGEYARVQSPAGGYTWYTTQGIKFKVPFISRVERFDQYTTVTYSRQGEDSYDDRAASVVRKPLHIYNKISFRKQS